MSTNTPEYTRTYRAKQRAAGKCRCGSIPRPGKTTCAKCGVTYDAKPHPCSRCGREVVQRKVKLCRSCTAHFNGMRYGTTARWAP